MFSLVRRNEKTLHRCKSRHFTSGTHRPKETRPKHHYYHKHILETSKTRNISKVVEKAKNNMVTPSHPFSQTFITEECGYDTRMGIYNVWL